MKSSITKITGLILGVIGSLIFAASSSPFNAYPGEYSAKLIRVETTNIIHITADVWSGYPKSVRITLPGIVVPQADPKAKACHALLMQKGLEFTQKYMTDAKEIKVKDIYMENTGEIDGIANIYTDSGSLVTALLNKGFARASSIDNNKPWC